MTDGFDSTAWVPDDKVYGLVYMLMCREYLEEELGNEPPPGCLKAKDSKLCGTPMLRPSAAPRQGKDRVPELEIEEAWDDDDNASYISEGEPLEQSEVVYWGKSQRGAWWRVRGALREDLVIRSGISLSSTEMRRAVPGEVFQQKGRPRVITHGKTQGCIRMPIQPYGWVTADASRAGGPQYLIRTHAPQWRAVYQAPGNGSGGQDIVVREGVELDSEAVGFLSCGDLVEQAGPLIIRSDGISRMNIVAVKIANGAGEHIGGAHPGISGFVTTDASTAGGPVFFKLIHDAKEADPSGPHKGRGRRQTGQP